MFPKRWQFRLGLVLAFVLLACGPVEGGALDHSLPQWQPLDERRYVEALSDPTSQALKAAGYRPFAWIDRAGLESRPSVQYAKCDSAPAACLDARRGTMASPWITRDMTSDSKPDRPVPYNTIIFINGDEFRGREEDRSRIVRGLYQCSNARGTTVTKAALDALPGVMIRRKPNREEPHFSITIAKVAFNCQRH